MFHIIETQVDASSTLFMYLQMIIYCFIRQQAAVFLANLSGPQLSTPQDSFMYMSLLICGRFCPSVGRQWAI